MNVCRRRRAAARYKIRLNKISAPSNAARRFAKTHCRAPLLRVLQLRKALDPEAVDELLAGCEVADSAGVTLVDEGLFDEDDGARLDDEDGTGEGDPVALLPVLD